MRKRLVVLIGALLAVVLVATAAQAGRHTQKVVNVSLAGWSSGPDEDALLNQVLAKFNSSHPGIHATFDVINGDYGQAMTARFAAHNPPDVFYVDSSVIGSWVHQGVIQPLNSYVSASHFDTSKFYPGLLGAFEKGKTIYGFPKDWSPLAMEANKAILKKAHVTIPTTWAGLKAAAQKIAKSGALPSGAKPICLSADWARMGAFIYQNGGSLTPKGVDTAATGGAVKFYINLIKSGLAATPDKLSAGWCGEALGKGTAAIIFEGNWVVPYMSSTFPDVAYWTAPMVKGKKQGNLAFTVSYSMAKDSKNKAAAWTLLSWLTSKVGQTIWMSKGLALPSRSDVKPVGHRHAFLAAGPYAHGWGFGNPYFAAAYTKMGNDLTAVLNGSMTVSAMLKDVSNALKGK
jgi:multiple sugar transport system substrate-binding protein